MSGYACGELFSSKFDGLCKMLLSHVLVLLTHSAAVRKPSCFRTPSENRVSHVGKQLFMAVV